MSDGAAPPARPLTVVTIVSGLAAVLVVVGVLGAWVSGGLGGVQVPLTTTTTVAAVGPTGGESVPAARLPTHPADDPQLGRDATRITFARPSAPLAPTPLGAWTEVAGRWAQGGGSARLSAPGAVRSLAVLHPAQAPTVVQLTLTRVDANAGLVVRYQDEEHYDLLVAVPSQHALWLAQVDGDPVQPRLLLSIGAPLVGGTRVGVRLAPDRLTVVVNGLVAGSVGDRRFADAPSVGLVAAGGFGSDPTAAPPSPARFGLLVVG